MEEKRRLMEEERLKRQQYTREAQGELKHELTQIFPNSFHILIFDLQILHFLIVLELWPLESVRGGRPRELSEEVRAELVYWHCWSLLLQERMKRRKERDETLVQKDKDKEMEVIKVWVYLFLAYF